MPGNIHSRRLLPNQVVLVTVLCYGRPVSITTNSRLNWVHDAGSGFESGVGVRCGSWRGRVVFSAMGFYSRVSALLVS